MKRLLRRIILVLGIVLFAVCGGAVLLSNRSTFGWQAMTVPTGSMRPGIAPGSVVVIHEVSPSTLRVGDVVTYTSPLTMRSTITHRIIKLEKLGGKTPAIITKGDANPSADPPAVEGLVKGKVVTHIPYLGSLLMWAKTWPGLLALIYLPAIIILVGETRRMADYLRRMKPYALLGVARLRPAPDMRPRLAMASLGLVVVMLGLGWQSASALLLGSNVVTLTPNVLTLAPATTPPSPPPNPGGSNTTCTNNTSVQTQNSSAQTGTSGNATVSGNTNGGSATSGSVTNNSSSNTSITVQNGCNG
jgi:signal peptidase I